MEPFIFFQTQKNRVVNSKSLKTAGLKYNFSMCKREYKHIDIVQKYHRYVLSPRNTSNIVHRPFSSANETINNIINFQLCFYDDSHALLNFWKRFAKRDIA